MKVLKRTIAGILLVVPLLVFSSVAAEQTTTSESTSNDTTTTETEIHAPDDNLTVEQRVEKRKAELKTKLTTVEQKRIQLKCKASQAIVGGLQKRVESVDVLRTGVYKELVGHLTALQTKLKAQNIDTSALDSEITVLNTKVTTFKTDFAAYKQAVSDLATMDCVKDPTGFKAALDTARSTREKAATDAADIRSYVNATVKPTLTQLKQQLETTKEGGQ